MLVQNASSPVLLLGPCRGSSFHENDRLSTVAAEHFKSLSRHSSPTEDREGLEPSASFCIISFSLWQSWHANRTGLLFQSRHIQKGIPAALHGEAGSSGILSASPRVRIAGVQTGLQRSSV